MKIKVSEVARELGLKAKEVVDIAKEIGIEAKTRGEISPMDAAKIQEYFLNGGKKEEKPKPKKEEAKKEVKEEKPQRRRRSRGSFNDLVKKTQKGIEVVKKAEPKPELEKKEEKQEIQAETQKSKPKPKPKPQPAKKREEKELQINVDLADMDVIEENQVELLDLYFNDLNLKNDEELEEKAKTKTQQQQQKQKKTQPVKRKKPSEGGITKETAKKKKKKKKKDAEIKTIVIPKEVRVYEFAEAINKPLEEVIEALRELGEERDKNDFLGEEYIETLAEEFEIPVEVYDPLAEFDYVKKYDSVEDDENDLVERPPIVTIMGHVDHGKTSLLDRIRNSRVAAKEAGGITQHIGAYMVEKDGKKITFIDTPGHEAFTEMRARGAQVTDIAIIVVAADDGVMPQTKEAIAHAQAAEVPFIVAVNKIDKPQANPDLVKSQLAEMGITPVEWGGEYEFVNVSAKTGEGIDDLLETILLQAEMMELKANPKRKAKAVVIESRVEKGKGPVATIIVKNGTLKKADSFVCGKTYGRVRLMIDDLGKPKKEVLPGEPAEITGFDEVPMAGDVLVAVESDKIAKETAEKWKEFLEEREKSKSTKATLEDLQKMILEGELKKLPVIVKADTQGSVEAIKGSLAKLKNEEVKVDIIHSDVGAITENDVILAKASEPHAIILGFNVRPTSGAKNKAKQEGIEIRTYSIIYDLIDDVKELLSGLMTPKVTEEVTATIEVRDVFMVPKVGAVAGCYVQDGVVHRGDFVRVIRDGVVIYDSKLASLKRFKDDVKEVGKGFECGIMVEGYNDVKVGDILETYRKIEEKAKFEG
ncbi:translation initiation factor IF-2 [Nautilia profundicola AmH]|uniref:Translation initiation factor IF-2 n=1 Tax=Nautilia profundicola (strain ATCC BAA-1463 / DSM 18972 / AmH) TaxID=598659 RepID=B9L6E4_NAUPA|nr:translation initiation factor IF-2 [Nautilia profundicola]ACM93586.1 translation initiation factor IF-2 [Nautilia profundicola AmH]